MKKIISATLISSMTLMGCATSSKDIATAYVSPMQYQAYDCDQLSSEVQRIQIRVNQLGGRLDEAASNDKALVGVGVILFWPALFALGGTKQQEAEYSRLKGEYDAVQQASVIKKCPGIIAAAQPAAPAPAARDMATTTIQ
jgi:outer membrane murein-binding lipoprotein Lpp